MIRWRAEDPKVPHSWFQRPRRALIALALGVSRSAGGNRTMRIVGGLLLACSLLGVTWPLCLDAQRQVLVTGGVMLADTGHLILAIVTVALMDGRVRSVVQTAVTGSARLRRTRRG
jgi:hypothetical protein